MASSAVGAVLSKLAQLAAAERNLLLGLEDEIEHVQMNLQWLSEFLADADEKRRDPQHGLVRVWVSQLRKAVHDLEDVLDEFTVHLDLQQMGFSGWKASRWLHCFRSPSKQLLLRHDLASQIIKINKKLELISNNRIKYLDKIVESSSLQQESYRDMTINVARTEVELDPTGQEAYIEEIRPQLLDSNAQGISIISIFGMGGLGKTTLAKRLYNDKEVASHFNLHAWLTISQTFSGIDLLRKLKEELFKLTREDAMKMEENEMKSKLKDHIREKSLITVMDDIWDTSCSKYFQSIIPEEHRGIAVLLTTRNMKVATDMSPDSQVIELKPLDNELSWQLFCKQVFGDGNCLENLQQFKDEVTQRCKGLPLSIVVLGGLLRRRNDIEYWKKVLMHISPKSEQEEGELQRAILALSYDHLPRNLKPCFLYVSGYPEDYNIQVGELTRMWIAEGFIQQQQRYSMEDLAEKYLEELIQRSLIQLVEKDELGHAEIVRVHDLVLDMACNEAQEINFLHQNLPPESSIHVRRLSLCEEDDIHRHFNCVHNYPVRKLHSLRIQCTESGGEVPSTCNFKFHPAKFLRVLNFRGIKFPNRKCPEAVGNMTQLRYLSFAYTNLKELPNNISNLRNLQTLDIVETYIEHVPMKFWEIASLRHVTGHWYNFKINPPCKQDVNKNNKLQRLQSYACSETNPPCKRDASKLSNLHTLKGIANYTWIIMDGLRKLASMRTLILTGVFTTPRGQDIDIRKLEEKLIDAIEKLKHLTSVELHYESASMRLLTSKNTSLQHVELWHRKQVFRERRENDEEDRNEIGQNWCLGNLRSLILSDMFLTEDDIDVIGLLPNLQSLHIRTDSTLTKLVFKEGSFSCLKQLKLTGCLALESWEANGDWSTKMLQLVQMELCPYLKVLPKGLQIKEIQLMDSQITEEVKSWAKQISESPTKTKTIKL